MKNINVTLFTPREKSTVFRERIQTDLANGVSRWLQSKLNKKCGSRGCDVIYATVYSAFGLVRRISVGISLGSVLWVTSGPRHIRVGHEV